MTSDHQNPRVGGFRSGDFESSGQGQSVINEPIVFTNSVSGGSGRGFYFSVFGGERAQSTASTLTAAVAFARFNMPLSLLLGTLRYVVSSTNNATELTVGLYDRFGNRLVQGINSAPVGNTAVSVSVSPEIQLEPEDYWFAFGGSGGATAIVDGTEWNTPASTAADLINALGPPMYGTINDLYSSGLPSSFDPSALVHAPAVSMPIFALTE